MPGLYPGDSSGSLPPDIDDFTVVGDNGVEKTYTVTYPDTYGLQPSGDPTPDDLVDGSAAYRQGEATNDCIFVTGPEQSPGTLPNTTQIVFHGVKNVPGERIELVMRHCV